MLQGYKDRNNGFFFLGLIDIHTVFVMDGEQLLADDGDDLFVLVVELEVQAGNVAAQDPAEAFDI